MASGRRPVSCACAYRRYGEAHPGLDVNEPPPVPNLDAVLSRERRP